MSYLKLCLKRASKASVPLIVITLILLSAASLLLFTYLSRDKEVKRIGVVGNTEDTYIDIALTLLSENESFEITPLSRDEAESLLKSGDIQGYAEIPEGFVSSAMKGKNIPFTYIALKKPSSLYHVITKETVSSVAVLLNESQNAVYGMRQYLKDNAMKSQLGEKSEEMSFKYVSAILQRKNLFDVKTVGIADSVSTVEYYFVSIIIVFALLLGASASPFMIKSHAGLPVLLKSRGISPLKQVLCELFAFFSVIYAIVFSLLFVVSFVLDASLFIYALKLIPVIFTLTALQFMIYEMSDALVSGTLFQFFASLTFAFISGCFYPSFLFPRLLRDMAGVLPVGSAFSLGRSLLSGGAGFYDVTLLLLWCVILTALSVIIRKIRIVRWGI